MAGRMTKATRAEKVLEAVDLSSRGQSINKIAEALEVQWTTARKLVDDGLAQRAEQRDTTTERQASIERNLRVIQAAWERFENTDNRSLNASGYLNTIIRAGERIDKLTGAEAPVKYQEMKEEYVIEWDAT